MEDINFTHLSHILTQIFEMNQQLQLSQAAMVEALDKDSHQKYVQKLEGLKSGELGKRLSANHKAFAQVLRLVKPQL